MPGDNKNAEISANIPNLADLGERLTTMNAAFVMACLAGGVIGPPTAGLAVDMTGTIGLPAVLIVAFGAYVLLALFQGREKQECVRRNQ